MTIENPNNGREMIDQEKLENIREKVIADLEKTINIYTSNGTKEWINENYTRELIEKFSRKEPVIPSPVLWQEIIDYIILDELGEKENRGPEWIAYWNALTGDQLKG